MADIHSTLSESLRAQAAHYEEIPYDEQEKVPGWSRIKPDAISERVLDNSACPFLKLPAELRNKVYSLVLIAETPIFVSTPRFFTAKPALALLSVCKQIRDEAREMFYAGNEFIFHVHEDPERNHKASNMTTLHLFLDYTTGLSDPTVVHTLVRDLFVLFDDLAWPQRGQIMSRRLDYLKERHFPSSRSDAKMLIG